MTPRDSIIARARKLSAMTIANGCSEAEANRAAELLAKLMAEHNLSQDETSVRDESLHCETHTITAIADSAADWKSARIAINQLFGTKSFTRRDTSDVLGLGFAVNVVYIKFFGLPADAVAALSMAEIVQSAINTEAIAWSKQARTTAQYKLRSFRLGMSDRLAERINELRPIVNANTGTALMVLKDQLVTKQFAKHFGKLRNSRGISAADANAYAAGQQRANSVSLGGQGTITSGPRRLAAR